MTLNEWAAQTKRGIFKDLESGTAPALGEYSVETLRDAQTLGTPQMGATTYSPSSARFEFVYTGANNTVILAVHVRAPHRIVFMPVPTWVVESIWQGDIDGSYHFEQDASRLLEGFRSLLEPESNAPLFGRKQAVRRE